MDRTVASKVKIVGVGSKNPAKIKAVERLCAPLGWRVIAVDAPSGVSAMPMTDEETKKGAVHRARKVIELSAADIGIGLEGGVMDMEDALYLCNWGALCDRRGFLATAAGARLPLPEALARGIRAGQELGELIDAYAAGKDVRKGAGTVGVLTHGRVTRDAMFYHVALLLFGQYEYAQR